MNTITRISRCTTTSTHEDPFARKYGFPLPAALRSIASGLTWQEFNDRFGSTAGPLRLGSWTDNGRTAGTTDYVATLAVADRIDTARATAPGPIGALTSMLYDAGYGLEILAFHQRETVDGTATFVHCEQGGRRQWSVALGPDAADSARRAIVAAANMLGRHS